MKAMFLTAAALAIASPAFAQSDPGMFSRAQAVSPSRADTTQSIATTHRHARSVATPAPDTVFDEYGHIIGADPDLNIRMQLYREHDSLEGF